MVIDSHAHLECNNMDTEGIIKNMHQDGLEKIVTIGTSVDDSKSAVKLAEKNKAPALQANSLPTELSGKTRYPISAE